MKNQHISITYPSIFPAFLNPHWYCHIYLHMIIYCYTSNYYYRYSKTKNQFNQNRKKTKTIKGFVGRSGAEIRLKTWRNSNLVIFKSVAARRNLLITLYYIIIAIKSLLLLLIIIINNKHCYYCYSLLLPQPFLRVSAVLCLQILAPHSWRSRARDPAWVVSSPVVNDSELWASVSV